VDTSTVLHVRFNVTNACNVITNDSPGKATAQSIAHQYIQFGKKQGEMTVHNLIRTIRRKLETDRFDNKRLELNLGTSTPIQVIEGALKWVFHHIRL
jgi:hypothetical protein